ncbi:LysR family transcriptional regulator [Xylophilus sp. Kf1]|nr:LysR family transcriptional regulator [Xylophilus sp. Kf1]
MHIRIDEEITFRRLEILLMFMETGNLARTAERLDTSTGTVHRALHALEAGVRCPLFRLAGRNLQPTDAAHALAGVAREVLGRMADGVRATREIAGYSGDRIRIGSLYSLTVHTVPRLIVEMKLRKPALQTELVLGSNADLLRKLRDGVVDAAVMAIPEGLADVEFEPLFEDGIHFAAPAGSPYEDLAEVDLARCAGTPFVSLTEGFATYDGFVEAFRIAGFTPDVVMKTGDIFSLLNLVSGGVGCTLVPGRVRDVFAGKVRLIPLQPRYRMTRTIGVTFLRSRERDPNLLALLATCRIAKRDLASVPG